ncbi:MAG: PAS domain S-box protein [Alphaproteobacteria bacterium]
MKAPTRQFLTATFLGLSLGAVLVFASHTVYQRNVEQARETTARKSQQAAYQIELLVSARLGVGRYLQQLWHDGGISTEQQFRRHARALLGTYSGIRFISRLDADGRFTWIEPETIGADRLGGSLRDDPGARETYDQVSSSGAAAPSPPYDFPDGANGFVNLSPLTSADRRAGYVNVAFHTAPIIDRALGRGITDRFRVEVRYGGRLIHTAGVATDKAAARVFAATDVRVLGREWTVTLRPAVTVLAMQIGNTHVAVLAVGLPAGLLISLLAGMFLSRHEALRASEAMAAALIENVPSSLNIKDLSGRYLRVNRTFCEWAQRSMPEVIGKTENEVHGDRGGTSDFVREQDAEVIDQGAPVYRERYGPFRDGVMRHVLVAKFPITDGAGQTVALGTAVTDISKQKEAEDVLRRSHEELEKLIADRTRELRSEIRVREIAETSWRESEERLRDIAESASDWFWEMDQDLRFTYISDRFFQITGLDRSDVLGKTRWEFAGNMDADERARFADHRADMEAHRPFRNFEYALYSKSGVEISVRLSGRPVFDMTGVFIGYRGAGTDITATRAAERALVRAKEDLERRVDERTKELRQEISVRRRAQELADQASRAKTDFLANVSHEFRTPLNGIIGFSEILAAEVFGPLGAPRYREYAEDIIRSGRHLLALINDVLDVSRIEAGAMSLHEEPVDLARAVEECAAMVEQRAEAKEIALVKHVQPDLPAMMADVTRIKQILLNLVTNAVKFTEQGGDVRVEATWSAEAGHALIVSDTGIGIDPKDIPKVLMPFGQAHRAFTRAHEGFGLGLSLVHSLTEEHGGSLEIDSAPGEGTTVTVRFPKARTVGDGGADAGQ